MDGTDLEILLGFIDRKIQQASPTAAEYWRGFCKGIKVYQQPTVEVALCEHSLLPELAVQQSPNPYFEAYARGYCDGCKGRMSPGY